MSGVHSAQRKSPTAIERKRVPDAPGLSVCGEKMKG